MVEFLYIVSVNNNGNTEIGSFPDEVLINPITSPVISTNVNSSENIQLSNKVFKPGDKFIVNLIMSDIIHISSPGNRKIYKPRLISISDENGIELDITDDLKRTKKIKSYIISRLVRK